MYYFHQNKQIPCSQPFFVSKVEFFVMAKRIHFTWERISDVLTVNCKPGSEDIALWHML